MMAMMLANYASLSETHYSVQIPAISIGNIGNFENQILPNDQHYTFVRNIKLKLQLAFLSSAKNLEIYSDSPKDQKENFIKSIPTLLFLK